MRIKVIGSHCCPDTLYALNQLAAAGAEIDFVDILASHADLKQYLALRDSDPLYAEIRGTEKTIVDILQNKNRNQQEEEN